VNWHTLTVAADQLSLMLETIRRAGGTITGSRPCQAGYLVTYVTDRQAGLSQPYRGRTTADASS
jgi:hypothetical protein